MAEPELIALAENIRQHGLHDDIVLFEGKILDGRNRSRACGLAEVTPTFTEFTGDSPTAFVLSKNLHRRQLTESQRAAVAVDSLPFMEAEAKERQKEHGETAPGRKKTLEANLPQVRGRAPQARDRAAKIVSVSPRSVQDAKAVKAQSPEKFEAIKRGELTVNKAKRELRTEEKKSEMERAAASITEEKRHHFESVCNLRHCSMAELFASFAKPGAVIPDAVISDPPYPKQFLALYGELARFCAKARIPLVAVMSGQSCLPEVLNLMTPHLKYRWTLAYLTPGGQAAQQFPAKVNAFWKPVLLFGEARESIGDVVSSGTNDNDKRFHEWGQSESGMTKLVDRLTKPGQLVCDPFMGAGTTAVACLKLNRKFIGCDIDAKAVKDAKMRVEALG